MIVKSVEAGDRSVEVLSRWPCRNPIGLKKASRKRTQRPTTPTRPRVRYGRNAVEGIVGDNLSLSLDGPFAAAHRPSPTTLTLRRWVVDRCRIFSLFLSSFITGLPNPLEKVYGPHNQGFSVKGTSFLFISGFHSQYLAVFQSSKSSSSEVSYWPSIPYTCRETQILVPFSACFGLPSLRRPILVP